MTSDSDRCRRHVSSIVAGEHWKIHFCLSGALSRVVRWCWIAVNPLDAAEPPRGVTHNPHPPSTQQAAAILTAAFAMDLWWASSLVGHDDRRSTRRATSTGQEG